LCLWRQNMTRVAGSKSGPGCVHRAIGVLPPRRPPGQPALSGRLIWVDIEYAGLGPAALALGRVTYLGALCLA
jgi:hypothetical protein